MHDPKTPMDIGDAMIDCLVQINKSQDCGSCTLCWASKKPIGFKNHSKIILSKNSPAAMGHNSMYARNVFDPETYKFKIVKPSTNDKLGKKVTRGKLQGAKIYTVTLEERATCTSDCEHWLDCYGNNMPFAHRIKASPKIMDRISEDLDELDDKGKKYLVRLHVLGDFFSVEYVNFWIDQIMSRPLLNVYGYTRWHIGTEIGDRINKYNSHSRFAIRFSNALSGFRAMS